MSEHVIELNGKRYDAITGVQLGKSKAVPVATRSHHNGKAVDGFVRITKKTALPPKPAAVKAKVTPEPVATITPAPKPIHANKPAPIKTSTSKPDIKPATRESHAKHTPAKRKPERSKTLMRSTVQRPNTSIKPAIKPQPPAEIAAKPASSIARKRAAHQVDPKRVERAIHTPKHAAITRFHHQGAPVVTYASGSTLTPIPVIAVRPAPENAPSAFKHSPSNPATHPKHTPHAARSKSHDIFEAAMHRANSHKELPHQPAKQKARRRVANAFAGIAAFLVLAGFIGYLNMPAFELKVASMQAGFSASVPDYRPTGYAVVGGIERVGGTVSVSFASGANHYTITQQASNWNSQTLLDSTLALNGEHTTIEENGQTIYVYGEGTSAAWVNGGVRYDLTGNAQLSKEDIASIATSL